MSKQKPWTTKEVKLLEDILYSLEPEDTPAYIAKLLNRSEHSVNCKASRLRRENKLLKKHLNSWTKKEDEILLSMSKDYTNEQIAERLNKGIGSISSRLRVYKIKKIKHVVDYDSQIRRMAEEGYIMSEIAKKLGFSPSGIRRYVVKNGIKVRRATTEEKTESLRRTINGSYIQYKQNSKHTR